MALCPVNPVDDHDRVFNPCTKWGSQVALIGSNSVWFSSSHQQV